ncbi:MAG TPA: diguanylate cyclase [Lachnospiraceae bacterium]|nr:diguanylate cyclase [Lachnospiraceae bacterium]
MKLSRRKGQLYRSLQAMSIFPLLILGLLIAAFSYTTVTSAMHREVKTELKNIAKSVVLTYNLLYPGDYHLEGTDTYLLFKGNQMISLDYSIIDTMKADTQVEITVFYQDTRMLTTIRGVDGERIVGTGVDNRIVNDILHTGIPHFYTNTTINEKQYFAYYTPLLNEDGSIVGMVYAGKPCSDVNDIVGYTVFPIFLIALFGVIVVSLISSSYTRKLIASLQKIRTFLSKVSTGNLWEELDASVLRRNDELSEMGYSALYMQISIRNLIEQDTLTELNNRRYADKRLKQAQMQANIHGTHFVIAIGDIDLFKSVNDTYGHECGDLVLKQVATVFKRNMADKGFVARWGGEEFLFVYDDMELETAKMELEKLLEQLRSLTVTYDDQRIYVTMTLGIAEGGINTNIKELLQQADAKLYEGKSSGRNKIVS